ncbi:MAG: hypothetical protein ACYCDN_03545, partial [Schaalia turicensis]
VLLALGLLQLVHPFFVDRVVLTEGDCADLGVLPDLQDVVARLGHGEPADPEVVHVVLELIIGRAEADPVRVDVGDGVAVLGDHGDDLAVADQVDP